MFERLEDRTLLAAISVTVDSTADEPDLLPGDGICATATGSCTLRAAVQETNANIGHDTITLPSAAVPYSFSRAGTGEDAGDTGDLDITDDLDIVGGGAATTIIDANSLDRAIEIFFKTVNITGVTITNGLAPDGGGILNTVGTLTITDSILSGNTAQGGGGGAGSGGGIFDSGGTLVITGSTITNNHAIGDAGSDGVGGGVFSTGGTWTIAQSTLSDNTATGGTGGSGFGGGVYATDFATFTVIETSTLSGNKAVGGDSGTDGGNAFGGGIYTNVLSTVTATNSTISGNQAIGGNGVAGSGGNGSGGGIYNDGGSTLTLLHVTIADNEANGGSGGTPGTGDTGGYLNFSGTAELKNTIVATNTASTSNPDVSGFFVSQGHNLIGDGTGSNFVDEDDGGVAGDQVGGLGGDPVIDPLLGPLQNNGGPTSTHELLTGSPAIDTADNTGAPAMDQRGAPRPIDGDGDGTAIGDIGAFEAALSPPPAATASLSGVVYFDANNNGLRDDGPTGINCDDAIVTLTGTDDLGNPVHLTATTQTIAGVPGSYRFTGLRPSNAAGYTLTETQPACFLDGKDSIGSAGGTSANDVFSNIVLSSGVNGTDYNFGELLESSLAGFIYHDSNNDGSRAGELGIAGATVTLTGTDDLGNAVNLSTMTLIDGAYSFGGLRPSDAAGYKLTETQPVGYLDGTDTIGTPGGTAANDMFSNIVLDSGVNGIENNFGERLPATISGTKFTDATGNGLTADDTPRAGVLIELFADANGNNVLDAGDGPAVQSATTAVTTGAYSFGNLAPGRYFVREVTPADSVRTAPTTTTPYYVVNAGSGTMNTGRDFANFIKCDISAVTSFSYVINGSTSVSDLTGNVHEGDDIQVTFTIAPAVSNIQISFVSYVAPSATFDPATASQLDVFSSATGMFSSGTGTLAISVPNSFFQVDFVCGPVIDRFGPAGSNISYAAQMRLIDSDNGGSQPLSFTPASLSGFVYVDSDNDGIRDSGEAGIGGVTVKLTGVDDHGKSVSLVTATAAAGTVGFYEFAGLRPGTYKIVETQPAGFLDGKDTIGTPGGKTNNDVFFNIVLNEGVNGTENNFGEAPPGCISGQVYLDYNDNGVVDSEYALTGVKITLTGQDDLNQSVTATTTTGWNGVYVFCGLRAGTYTVTETQPSGFVDGIDTRGTVDGVPTGTVSNDTFSNITLAANSIGINYNFGERPSGTTLMSQQTATIEFWRSNDGQALITQLNGGPNSQDLGNWLATNFPNLYGPAAGSNNLTCKTNAQVAAYFVTLFDSPSSIKAEAQVLATALAVYVTNSTLAGGTFAEAYGFIVDTSGTGSAEFNVRNNGPALGVAKNAVLSIYNLLRQTDALTINGVLNGGDAAKRKLTNVLYSVINQTGDIDADIE